MAIQPTMVWRIRVGGDNLNGGGFDSAVSGAGTDYTEQDSPQLSLTDLACANSTTLTSATGGFTTAMIGNVIRIASGTNFTAGYYVVTARTDTNTVTLDRNPTNGSSATGGTGRLGGAWAGINNVMASGPIAGAITSPLVPGNVVYIRGSGNDNPTSVDYPYTDYGIVSQGDITNGLIKFIGYNGRPMITFYGLLFHSCIYVSFEHIYFRASGTLYQLYGAVFAGNTLECRAIDCVFDQAGYDVELAYVTDAINCKFINTGGGGVVSRYMLKTIGYTGRVIGCEFYGLRGTAIGATVLNNSSALIMGNKIINCLGDGIYVDSITYKVIILHNTLDNNGGHGINLTSDIQLMNTNIFNNIISRHLGSGKYGIAASISSASKAERFGRNLIDYNVFYLNTAHIQTIGHGSHDLVDVDPMYTVDFTPQNPVLDGRAMSHIGLLEEQ